MGIVYNLTDIDFSENMIQVVSDSILFSALFSGLPQPDHSIIIKKLRAVDNQIYQSDSINKPIFTNLINAIKINYISIEEFVLHNNHHISSI